MFFYSNIIRRWLLFCFCVIFAIALESCGNNRDLMGYDHPGPPNIMVCFVPLDGFSGKEAILLSKEFFKNFAETQWEPYCVKTLEHKTTPPSCLNDSKSRFRGNKIIRWLSTECPNDIKNNKEIDKSINYEYYFIGVTDKDISTNVHNHKDYGILGLSYLGKGDVSIISTHRLKRRKDLWKLAVHEFCHGFYGCPHCKTDNPHCIMSDAKGGNPHFEMKNSLCSDCKAICLIGD